jgi:hypothetical protein
LMLETMLMLLTISFKHIIHLSIYDLDITLTTL